MKMQGRTQAQVDARIQGEKVSAARATRDQAIAAVEWRLTRYERQERLGTPPTDTAQTYQAVLTYVQALRDWPGTEGFPELTTMPVWAKE